MHDAATMTLRLEHPIKDAEHKSELQDCVEGYVYNLRKFGHIWGDFVISWTSTQCSVFAYLAHPSALDESYILPTVHQDIENIHTAFGQLPAWKILDEPIDPYMPVLSQEQFLYVFTHAFDDSSPLCLGSSGFPVPLVFLPLTELEREHLYHWMTAYREHDRIWLNSGTLEIPAYKELADPESELTQEGRKLCQIVEEYVKIPTYYYLHRYWGRRHGEENRRCPGCGSTWERTENVSLSEHSFSNFVFQCVPCRLVSHLGDSTEDERHARIGEYRPRSS